MWKGFQRHAGAMAAALMLASLPVCAQAQEKRPNVVVIMTDDTGWGDLGVYGGGKTRNAPTPNLDQLAAEGTTFTEWYGQASCTAGRASFMTGRLPVRSALSVVIAPGDPNSIRPETPTIAEFFKKNGYQTYFSGKWHLGDTIGSMPINHGFDTMKNFLAYYSGVYAYTDTNLHPDFPRDNPKFMAAYWSQVNDGMWEGEAGQPPRQIVEHFTYTDLATVDQKQAADTATYIRAHANDAKPMFMYVAFTKMHNPTNVAPEFKGRSHASMYLDSLMEMDANSGTVLQALRAAGIDKNTIVLWTVDNGAWIDAYPDAGYQPFRGMKGTGFEGGWRVPTIISWPGHIPAGRKTEGITSHMDFWPTAAALAGLTPPPHGGWVGNDGKPIYFDGIDNSAFFLGKAEISAQFDDLHRRHRHARPAHRRLEIHLDREGYLARPAADAGGAGDLQPEAGPGRSLRQDVQRRGAADRRRAEDLAGPLVGPGQRLGAHDGAAAVPGNDEIDEGFPQHRYLAEPGAGRRRPAEVRGARGALLHGGLKIKPVIPGRCEAPNPESISPQKLIGVGIGFRRPRPPNRTGGFPAYGSPVGGFFIETVSLIARRCEARTARHSRSTPLTPLPSADSMRSVHTPASIQAQLRLISAPCLASSALPVLLCPGMVFTHPPSCPAFPRTGFAAPSSSRPLPRAATVLCGL